MDKGTRICKVCGKEYPYCKTALTEYKFRYQDVACSPECGAEYFAQVEAARNPKKVEVPEGFAMNEPIADETVAEEAPAPKKASKKSRKVAEEEA